MGCYEGWTHPNGFYANGLLAHESDSVTRLLDPDRWSMAEEATAELIACIQPNQLSEERRNAVASYVKRLIGSCFSCQVFTFGSVPLKTYLPDGDIDLTAFGNETLKDAWASEVRDMLEKEEKNDDAEFRVKEVQYIQAEVKLVKCLVDNIVVDISFNQLGGLCTLCFLEEVDSLVNQNHLFKRSIILIKAWCYYESRILGAHHGLISTYALETLVLYIFHVFNNSFAGPLEVLYRFLEFFSKFDWDRFCVSLWGPVPISLLPDMTADPPRKDGGELLLSKVFLDACSSVYSAFPSGQENHELPFVSKHFNVIDPLRTNNNLGRSVSKGNFFRIRSAFSYGAQRLAKLLDCPKEDITAEVSQFFMNTMERHGRGPRPDIPKHAVYGLQSANRKQTDETNSVRTSSKKNVKQSFADHESEVEKTRVTQDSHGGLSRLSTQLTGRVPRSKNMSSVSHKQTQKTDTNLTSSTGVSQNNQMSHGRGLNENAHTLKGRSSRADNFGNEILATARNPFARTHSSPELKDTANQFSSQGRNTRSSERTKGQAMARLDHGRSKNLGAEVSESNNAAIPSQENVSSFRHSSLHERIHESRESNAAASNRYHDGSGSGLMSEDRSVAEAMQMQQEEQDLVNMMASSGLHNFNGNFHLPMNFASHLPIPMSPSVLASLGHAYRNSAGIVPTNISSFESTPWGPNLHYPQGLVTFPMSQYFSSLGMAPKQPGIVEPVLDELMERETFKEDSDQGLWSDRDMDSVRGHDVDNQMLEENKQFIPGVHPGLGSRTDRRGFYRENFGGIPQHQNFTAGSDTYGTGTNFVAVAHGTSKVKESSEASSDGSPLGIPGPITYQQGRKFAPSVDRSAAVHENGWQHESELVDHVSSRADDDSGDWVPLSVTGKEMRDTVPGAVSSSNIRAHDIPGHELTQLNGSKPVLPVSPMLVNSAMYQRGNDNNDSVPLTFYPTGPPVPFVTMLPYYNYPSEKGTSDGNHIDRGQRLVHSRISQFDEKIDSTENLDEIESLSCSSSAKGAKPVELSEEQKSDILNSDFASHWQNLQYGRVCQSPRDYGPMLYPPSVVVPPAFMQGQLPFDNPERPLSANANLFTQIMGYGPRLNPVSPLQPGSTRPLSSHGPYGDEGARYRGGTGTYLPNPAPFRERHPSSGRNRGNYSYDRNDHHGDREGNWKLNSRQRYSGRGRGRNQFERAGTRTDRSIPSNSRSDRPWNAFKHESVSSANHSQNTPFSSLTSTQTGSSNVPYGSYPFQIVNRDGGPSGGALPPFLMLYPYEQNMVCGSGEQLEFGSHGVPFSGMHEGMQLGEDSFQSMQRNYRVNSAQSSPDKPSSPRLPR